MTDGWRIVLDTNIIVSALLFPQSVPRQAFDKAHDRAELVASPPSIAELVKTLHKPKLQQYISPPERDAFLQSFVPSLEIVMPREKVTVCRDPRDNIFLELAVAGGANLLITGDQDLLALGSFRDTDIITAKEFLAF